ncbi:MAG TPA: MBOAT family protein [Steroidobacteraceae bacterium]|nr:MBOAT family protein [Steroidobacteraceae bacterium]
MASLAFYGYWRLEHTVLLLCSITFNYVFGELILRARARGERGKGWLACAITANLGALAYFKYADFFLGSVNEIAGTQIPLLHVVLPLGVSFFTFTQIAYLVDVYAGKVVERNPVHYALFVTYFPHLIAGPVLHHAEMMPQFRDPAIYQPRLRNFVIGMAFLLMGLAKKVLVADSVAPLANAVFDSGHAGSLSAAAAWLGVTAYTLQIYFDFSGYSDMAVGLSLLIGVRLPYNFNSPYQSWNITEFWRRWHMTLSRFLRDYLYVPLGGNRRGQVRRYVNLMITMLLGGLWHGASWTFVVWGGLHGMYLVVNHGWQWVRARFERPRESRAPTSLGRVLGGAVTLFCVMVAWVFFRATDVHSAFAILRNMFGIGAAGHFPVPIEYTRETLVWIAFFSLLALFGRNSQSLIDGSLTRWLDRSATRNWQAERLALITGASCVGVALMAVVAASRNVSEFIYFNF